MELIKMKRNIGIVEDDVDTLNILMDSINGMAYFTFKLGCRSVDEFLQRKANISFDIILLDLGLPDASVGLEAISILKEKFSEAEIIVLTSFEDEHLLVKALSLGATGYLFKREALSNLEEYLNDILMGGSSISPNVARKIVEHFNQKTKISKSLNIKEQKVLKLLADGLSYEEIAQMLEIKLDTVRYYIKSIYKKLHVTNRSGAIKKYFIYFFK